jgi:hypothetical protein
MTVQQQLPTCSSAGSIEITSISRDSQGNVLAEVADLGGFEPGQVIVVTGIADATFNGSFELVSATLNQDGFTGVIGWQSTHLAAAASTTGTATSAPDMVINYDDSFLISQADLEVTNQLSSVGRRWQATCFGLPRCR